MDINLGITKTTLEAIKELAIGLNIQPELLFTIYTKQVVISSILWLGVILLCTFICIWYHKKLKKEEDKEAKDAATVMWWITAICIVISLISTPILINRIIVPEFKAIEMIIHDIKTITTRDIRTQ